ncbi:MAG: 2Fe-2S iron-sulfur cluster-binding protein, partial [Desulfococcus multivorans]|nr:2Fe-2S iron-sulfur cluster-binding protein [Desulfococcus multivorans]
MSDLFKIRFEPMGLAVAVSGTDSTIMEAALIYGLPMRFDCGGKGVCGKCLVVTEPPENMGPITDAERRILSPEQLKEGQRLACQAVVRGHVRVTVPEQMIDSSEVRGKDGVSGSYAANPLVSRIFLPKTTPPEPMDGRSATLESWILDRAAAVCDRGLTFRNRHALGQAGLPDQCTGEVTLAVHEVHGVTAVLTGRRPASLGIAFDLGTTTLAAYLCDLKDGRVLTTASAVNPQRRFGEDVISRIAYANRSAAGFRQMQGLILDAVNGLIEQCIAAAKFHLEDVDEVTVVGNTTMLQIFAGFHPSSLGVTPYLPVAREFPHFNAADLSLSLNPGTPVHILPVVSGFVGGDTMGAALADGPYHRDGVTLIIDIGTNGEVMLSTP